METICSTVKNINPYYVAGGAIAQYIFGMLWFGVIVRDTHLYHYAADKGVRRPEHAIHRYPKAIAAFFALVAAVARSVVVLAIAATYNATTLCDYQCAAAVAAAIISISIAKYIANQRPFALIVTEGGYEVVATMIAAVVAFYMKENGI